MAAPSIVEQNAVQFGAANYQPRFFTASSPRTLDVYANRMREAERANLDTERLRQNVRQEQLITDRAEAVNPFEIAQAQLSGDRLRTAMDNQGRVANMLTGLTPGSPDYLSKRSEIIRAGGTELPGVKETLTALDQEHHPYEVARNEAILKDQREAIVAPRRAEFLGTLSQLDPSAPDYGVKSTQMLAKYADLAADTPSMKVFEEQQQVWRQADQTRRTVQRTRSLLSPTGRDTLDTLLGAGEEPETAVEKAQRLEAFNKLANKARSLGIDKDVDMSKYATFTQVAGSDGKPRNVPDYVDVEGLDAAVSGAIGQRRMEADTRRTGATKVSLLSQRRRDLRSKVKEYRDKAEDVPEDLLQKIDDLDNEIEASMAGAMGEPAQSGGGGDVFDSLFGR